MNEYAVCRGGPSFIAAMPSAKRVREHSMTYPSIDILGNMCPPRPDGGGATMKQAFYYGGP